MLSRSLFWYYAIQLICCLLNSRSTYKLYFIMTLLICVYHRFCFKNHHYSLIKCYIVAVVFFFLFYHHIKFKWCILLCVSLRLISSLCTLSCPSFLLYIMEIMLKLHLFIRMIKVQFFCFTNVKRLLFCFSFEYKAI